MQRLGKDNVFGLLTAVLAAADVYVADGVRDPLNVEAGVGVGGQRPKWPEVRTGWAGRRRQNRDIGDARRWWRCIPGGSTGSTDSTCRRCDTMLNTRKLDPRCQLQDSDSTAVAPGFDVNAGDVPLLVTGCGGTGTTAVTEMLQKRGVEAKHETFAAEATVSWTHAVSDWYLQEPVRG